MNGMDIEMQVKKVMACAVNIRKHLGPGYLESVYKNAMLVELEKNGLTYEVEKPINVYYENVLVGEFKADIVVEDDLHSRLIRLTEHITERVEILAGQVFRQG